MLIVSKFFYPSIGGIETVVNQHAQFLSRENYQITIICHNHQISLRTHLENQNGIHIIRCACWGKIFSQPVSPTLPLWLWVTARKHNLVMLHLPNPIVTLSSLFFLRHIRIIVFWHSDIIRQKTLKWIVQPLQRILCRRANKILTTSWNLAQNSNVISCFTEKLSILPLSVPVFLKDRGNIQAIDKPPSLSEIPSQFALFLGRLCYYKGIDILLNAITHLSESDKEFPLVIAGDGPLVEKIKSDLKNCTHPSIIFISRAVNDLEKQWLLQNASFFIFPSTESNEAFGIIQLEAMKEGTPIINTDLPTGVPLVSVHEDTGLTVPPRDPEALAQAISRLIQNPQERLRFGKRAQNRVKTYFQEEQIRDAFLSEVQSTLNQRSEN